MAPALSPPSLLAVWPVPLFVVPYRARASPRDGVAQPMTTPRARCSTRARATLAYAKHAPSSTTAAIELSVTLPPSASPAPPRLSPRRRSRSLIGRRHKWATSAAGADRQKLLHGATLTPPNTAEANRAAPHPLVLSLFSTVSPSRAPPRSAPTCRRAPSPRLIPPPDPPSLPRPPSPPRQPPILSHASPIPHLPHRPPARTFQLSTRP